MLVDLTIAINETRVVVGLLYFVYTIRTKISFDPYFESNRCFNPQSQLCNDFETKQRQLNKNKIKTCCVNNHLTLDW